jgi:hypothetical protein
MSSATVDDVAVALADRLCSRFAIPEVVRYFDKAQFVETNREKVLSQTEARGGSSRS